MSPYLLLAPEILLLVGAILALFGEWLPGGRDSTAYWGAAFAAVAAVIVPSGQETLFSGTLTYDDEVFFARSAIAALTAVFLLWMAARGAGAGRPQEAVSMALFSALGGLFLVAASDLITLYMSLELSTMPAYVLIGLSRRDARGLEGALKYFLLSLLTSLVMVYGLSFVFGFSGTTYFADIDLSGTGNMGVFIGVFVVVGFLAKLSAAPFHYWTPDAYEGATPHAVAFVSTVPKVAGLVAMVHLMSAIMPEVEGLGTALWIAAVASMVLGNLGAFPQNDMRRLMAYSGIAHTGYLLMGITAGTATGSSAAVFYAVAYAIPSLGAMLVFAEHGTDIEQLDGLASRRPWVAWAIVAFFLSLVGIPPLVGFFGKLYLFGAAVDVEMYGLVIIAVAMSVASLGYYFRVVKVMFFEESPADALMPKPSGVGTVALAACLVATFVVGVVSSPLLSFMGLTLP